MKATITTCRDCQALKLSIADARAKTVPGTGGLDCAHLATESPETVSIQQLVHVALSTLLRSGLEGEPRVLAHQIQERLNVPDRLRSLIGIPYLLTDGYGVSETGLAVARLVASTVAKIAEPSEAFYWKAAASVMRRRIGNGG